MAAATFETILLEQDGPVVTITMNRPERKNAMTNRMVREVGDALAIAAEDKAVRVLVLTGAGTAFCPGADLQAVAGGTIADEPLIPSDFRAPVLLHQMPAVTIAAINGACAGAGFGWACACDFRFAAESARFNTALLDVGIAGDMGGPWTLARIVGPARARELYMLPAKFDAAEALRIGLVSRVFGDADFRARVGEIVERLASAAPIGLKTSKANFVDAERMDFAGYVALESERHLRMFTYQDTREAFAARVENRAPKFEGR
jgi:2-(1,2-epoxy-1,2-dihydrophenyl)acetyl-CoA isomerase